MSAYGDIKCEGRGRRNADVATDKVVDVQIDRDGLCAIGDRDVNRQDDMILIAECFQTKDREPVRGGPQDIGIPDVL